MKRKILHIQLLPILSGAQNVMLHLLDNLPDEYEIYVAHKPGGPLDEAIRRRGFVFIPLPTFRHPISLWDPITLIYLIYIIHKYQFSIVHTHTSKPGLLGRIAARVNKVPLVVHTVHSLPFHAGQSKLEYWFYVLIERLASQWCDVMVFVNNIQRERSIKLGITDREHSCTIYNALPPKMQHDLELISQSRYENSRYQGNGKVIIGSILRFANAKNIVQTVEVACRVCKARPMLEFIFVGDGEYLSRCKKMVLKNHLEHRIHFPGWQFEILTWLEKFDIFILNSTWEAFPMSIIEAMFTGLPVLSSDIPGVVEIVSDSNGWLVPSHDPEALFNCLLSIADHPEMIYKKGQAALQTVKQRCSFESLVNSYQYIYLHNQPPVN